MHLPDLRLDQPREVLGAAMQANDWMQIVIFFAALIALTPILGGYMAKVFEGQPHLMSKPLGWLERLSYRAAGVDPKEGMQWKRYCGALLMFNLAGFTVVWLSLIHISEPTR